MRIVFTLWDSVTAVVFARAVMLITMLGRRPSCVQVSRLVSISWFLVLAPWILAACLLIRATILLG